MTAPREDWGDARLDAAFAARAAAQTPTPPDLAVAVLDRISRSRRPTSTARRLGPALGAAAAIAVAVIVGVGQFATSPPAASSVPGASETRTRSDARPALGAAIPVAQAVAIRDAGVDDREIVVSGFLGGAGLPLPCPAPTGQLNPTRLVCPQSFAWLMQDPESLTTTSPDGSGGVHPPVGPAIHPSFALVGQPSDPSARPGTTPPPQMTVVGHFDDRRAELCATADHAACRDTFIVDRVSTGDDLALPSTTVAEEVPSPKMTEADVDDVIRHIAPEVAILAHRIVAGKHVVALEPALAGDIWYSGFPVVWVVTGLGVRDGMTVARTFLVVDGSPDIVEMTPAGPVTREVPRPTPQPTPAPSNAGAVRDLLAHPITVAEAIARRDANLDDTEMAVEGYASYPPAGLIDCLDVIGRPATFAGCDRRYTWLAESAEMRPDQILPLPAGPAFNLFFQPETLIWDRVAGTPTHVIAMGHFDDHRAALCRPEKVEACRRSFVVDSLLDPTAPDRSQGLVKVDQFAAILTTIDDAIHFAGLELGDPSIVAAFAVQNRNLAQFEPAAVGAPELKGNSVWIVRWLDGASGRPVIRTRLVTDDEPDHRGIGSFEVDAGGLHPVSPAPLTTDPGNPFSAAPTTVLGLNVMDVETALERQPQLSRTELAVRGWYLPPDPRSVCVGRDPIIHSIEPPCDAARHWLLQGPEQLWTDPATVDPRPAGPFLNPILPSDVRFSDLPDPWADGTPEPMPVILVGHFQDTRSQTRSGSQSFVVDGLVWHPGTATDGTGSVTRLTEEATESPEVVIARVNAEIGIASATWTSVMRTTDFPILDPYTPERRPELLNGHVLWVVKRLVPDLHARDRLVVDTAYVVDGNDQVWLKPADADPDLATTIDVGPFGEHTRIVQIYDYDHWIVSVRRATAADNLTWRYTDQERDGRTLLEVARGASDRVIGVRWTGSACATDWRLLVDVNPSAADPGPWIQPRTFGDGCDNPGEMVTRALVVTFDRPIDLNSVRAVDDRCCG